MPKDPILFPSDLGEKENKKNFIKMEFIEHSSNYSDYELARQATLNNEIRQSTDNDVVYLPFIKEVMLSSVSSRYNTERLNFMGNLFYNSAQNYGGSIDALKKTMKESSNISGEAAAAFAGYQFAALLNTELDTFNGAKFAAGVAYNPNLRTLYDSKDVKYRQFVLNWQLYPRNEEEAIIIKKIENVILKGALPATFNIADVESVPFSNYTNHFKYPKKVLVTLYIDNQPYNRFKILPAVIETMEISHNQENPTNDVIFMRGKNGEKYFSSTNITISLKETKIFTRDDVALTKEI